tara:strand:- start:154 stop:1896 length:1743 start_codon:yes stop_codon:yes gene_type:complete
MRYFIFLLFYCSLSASTARIMTYNLLNFSDDNEREDDFIEIIEFIQPDIIIAQEVNGQAGFSNFKSDVLDIIDPNIWTGADFINQSAQQDIALYYKHEHFSFLSTSVIYSAQSSGTRDVIEWVIVHNNSNVQFRLYGVHFKASSGSSNAAERLEEATILREYLNELPPNSYFIVGGDFNIYSNSTTSEPAFEMLTGYADDNDGRLFDPIDRIGHWHNNSSYADVHTQSTRTTQFGGGANGGMDDRFDWLFVSQGILNDSSDMYYIENTYWAVGNDGNHFNDAINDGNNTSVSDDIADALHDASDHLPVYMDVWFDDLVYSDQGIVISEIMVNPAAVSDSYGEWFEITNISDSTIDIQGWTIKDSGQDEHSIVSDEQVIPISPGEYFVFARNADPSLNGGLDVVSYQYENFSFSNSEDEIILLDTSGAIVDEVYYSNTWPLSSGSSMEIHDPFIDNSVSDSWFESTLSYGGGDNGSPGIPFDGALETKENGAVPMSIILGSPYPNPFNPLIKIPVHIKVSGSIILEIFNMKGGKIKTLINLYTYPGYHELQWDATDHPSGIYFFKLSSNSHSSMEKAILIK